MVHSHLQITACPSPRWHELASQDPSCTFFQTQAWLEVVSRYTGWRSSALLFEGERFRAVLPLLQVRRGLFPSYGSPLGTYTWFVSRDEPNPSQAEELRAFLERQNIEVFGSPFSSLRLPFGTARSNVTYLVDLTGLDPDRVHRRWKEGHRGNWRKGTRKGVTVRVADDWADWERYFAVYVQTVSRWGAAAKARYEKPLFQIIWEVVGRSPRARLWIAEWHGTLICGCLIFYHGRHAVAWHAAANPEHSACYGNQVLFYSAIRDAIERGFAVFDFNPSRDLEGVSRFKEGFGTVQVSFDSYSHRTLAYRAGRSIKRLLRQRSPS